MSGSKFLLRRNRKHFNHTPSANQLPLSILKSRPVFIQDVL
ncbi:hypothetical protein RR46_14748 [Papilio xuthus]|uniref:Uncharacterized protein n=1 Tax=Papilio xuthus TaxID=66420 RepID=A0A194PEW9_PAPXU|nr:hypothetical protein RR46_14748 [Papilio xuthus]